MKEPGQSNLGIPVVDTDGTIKGFRAPEKEFIHLTPRENQLLKQTNEGPPVTVGEVRGLIATINELRTAINVAVLLLRNTKEGK